MSLKEILQKNKINKRCRGFVFSKNDCFSLFCAYDEFIKGGDSSIKDKIGAYNSNEEFFGQLQKHYADVKQLMLDNKYIEVKPDRLEAGDVCYLKDMQGSLTVAIKYEDNIWFTSSEVPRHDILKEKIIKSRGVYFFRLGRTEQ